MTQDRSRRCAAGAGAEPGEARWREGEWTPARRNRHSSPVEGSMGVLSTGHLRYHPSSAASELLAQWKRVVLEFVVDGETRKPRAVRLTPATAGLFSYKVRLYGGQRPWVDIPTSTVGWAARSDPRAVEETISPSEIVVSIPFEFRP